MLAPWKKSYGKPRHCIQKQRHHFVNKGLCSQSYGPVVTYGYESWAIKKAEPQRIDASKFGVGEDSWESLGLPEIKPVTPKGIQPWIFLGKTDASAETPILWPSNVKSGLRVFFKTLMLRVRAGGVEGDIGWHHQLNAHEFEQTLGDSEGQGSLECCNAWLHRVRNNLATEETRLFEASFLSGDRFPLTQYCFQQGRFGNAGKAWVVWREGQPGIF